VHKQRQGGSSVEIWLTCLVIVQSVLDVWLVDLKSIQCRIVFSFTSVHTKNPDLMNL
jgi:hypothetical protein